MAKKPLAAGRLRHRVTIEAPATAQDPTTGAMTTSWQTLATVFAAIEPLSVRDLIAAQAVKSELAARIVIRHRTDITPACRIKHGAKLYQIIGLVPDADSGREYLTIMVRA